MRTRTVNVHFTQIKLPIRCLVSYVVSVVKTDRVQGVLRWPRVIISAIPAHFHFISISFPLPFHLISTSVPFKAELLQTVYKGKYFCGSPERPALVNRFVTFLLDCTFGNDTATSEK